MLRWRGCDPRLTRRRIGRTHVVVDAPDLEDGDAIQIAQVGPGRAERAGGKVRRIG